MTRRSMPWTFPAPPPYPNGKIYKSTDGGVTWTDGLSRHISAAGAKLPVWNIAVAPDDVNFVVAVTDGVGPPGPLNGPTAVFVSQDGGANWQNTNLVLPAGYISCVDISMNYGNACDIAVGTRTGVAVPLGRVYVCNVSSFGWLDQGLSGDVVALKFSPNYNDDNTIVVVYSNGTGTYLNAGGRDISANTTNWAAIYALPIEVTTGAPGTSPDCLTEIITADLELPSDFSGSAPGDFRRYYVSTDATVAGVQIGVYRIDNTVIYRISPPLTPPPAPPRASGISSIAYSGTYDGGELLAGEVTADNTTGVVSVWRTSDPISNTPYWPEPDAIKSPTGGGILGYANAQVAWGPDGARAYCGTSSANLSVGGTSMVIPGTWPLALTTSVALDESAFSVSPYTPAYEQLLDFTGKHKDGDIGNIWNQLSLIDTQINFLSDVAVLEISEIPEEAPKDYYILYLASVNVGGFDSMWRSTSSPLGKTWERVLTDNTSDNGIILRVNQRITEEGDRSQAIVFADRNTSHAGYSSDEGQSWPVMLDFGAGVTITDLTLASDEVIYILNNALVRKGSKSGTSWIWQGDVDTYLVSGHTIDTPLKNPEKESGDGNEDWVIVGEAAPPLGLGMVAYADFSKASPKFEPPVNRRIQVPVPGNMHVIADDKFEQNKTIYAASEDHDPTGGSGKIYRWVIDESTAWEELEPPNSEFYGLAQRNDVLYGVWHIPGSPTESGVDRTLYPRAVVPPALEWDDLTAELPTPPPPPAPPPPLVSFTCEPSALKIASNDYNDLWAIDDKPYNWRAVPKDGCLWAYTDTIAKVGPWTTAPASGDFIPVDPVSGRAKEVNFKWRRSAMPRCTSYR